MGILVQKQYLTGPDNDFFISDDINHLSLAHVDHFHIGVPVGWKMHKAGVLAHSDELSPLQHLAAVNGKLLARNITLPFHLCPSFQNLLFFLGDLFHLIQQLLLHMYSPNLC